MEYRLVGKCHAEMFVLAYETGHFAINNSPEVELITNRLFKSKVAAWTYFHKRYNLDDFINPQVLLIKLGDCNLFTTNK
jgi:hypothetical protein